MAEILVLDDVESAVKLIEKVLEKAGHKAHGFTEEDDALEFVKENPVDLAVLDLRLKKMDGVKMLKELKSLHKDIKGIILTGYPTPDSSKKAKGLGVTEYLVKPVSPNELRKKVDKVLKAG